MRKTISDKVFVYITYFILGFSSFIALYPILMAFSVSITDNLVVELQGFSIIPKSLTLDAYKYALRGGWVFNAYFVTLRVVILGTFASILISSMLAYGISVKSLKYRKAISLYVFISLVFNAGLIPWYIVLTRYYGIGNSIISLIVPYLVNPWFVFLLRNYFEGIPASMSESAKMDGANNFTIYFRIILPLSIPIIATVALFVSLIYWDDWWLALLFLRSKSLYPLQYMLFNILSNITFLSSGEAANLGLEGNINVPRETVKMATMFITIGPIMLFYPYIQKYFVKGIMVGAVKG